MYDNKQQHHGASSAVLVSQFPDLVLLNMYKYKGLISTEIGVITDAQVSILLSTANDDVLFLCLDHRDRDRDKVMCSMRSKNSGYSWPRWM